MKNSAHKDLLKKLMGHIPTAMVFVGLAALFIWGHNTGWKFPDISDLVSQADDGGTELKKNIKYSVAIAGMT